MSAKKKLETAATSQFKRTKKVENSNLLEIKVHEPIFVRFESTFLSKLMKKKPATFAPVTNVETGEVAQILLGTVLVRLIEENYPNQTYVGKTFEIIKGEKVKGSDNSYFEYELFEIES